MTSDIWTEKYRPKVFADVLGQDEIVKRVEAFVNKKSMPHLLFSGPAGVGKTSLALVTVKALFGDSWRSNFLELNASDERGIDVVRNKVKDFARTRAIGDVPFKIIYLDECDALTKEAQQALRRTMENYTQTCRFVLSCNYSSKIIDPIQSRCAIFRFKLLPKQDLIKVINSIAEKENINIDDSAKEALFNICDGDCRRAENILQSSAVITDHITDEIIYSLASVARPKEIKEIIQLALNNKFIDSRKKLLDIMLEYGLSGLDIIKQIQKEVPKIDAENKKKMELIEFCGEAEFRMTEGSDEYVQLEALLAKIVLVGYK
ncbi:replication factor C small subunit [Candidatus Woesearchaeota archaeon]|jgi:replication factor C small subunit|nr:replication factor C small subunit [Candidatus Woesearchaeota archaeon]MBT6520368.1 replication factor C small subunit [Candidatus Woesearchaeota archaeon]MBT7368550.1 replication factor C small subunit [Candidatus Woesearchaeota archaeon]